MWHSCIMKTVAKYTVLEYSNSQSSGRRTMGTWVYREHIEDGGQKSYV